MWYSSCYKEIWRIRRGQGQKKDWKAKKTFKIWVRVSQCSSLRDRRKSSKDLAHLAQHLAASSGCQVDPSTVWRSLIRNGLCGRVAAKKPLFQKGNRVKRLRYAKAHKDWNEDQWKRVLWSDESKFLGPIINNMWEEELERDGRMSACGLQWNMVEGLSWFGAAFLPVVLAILSELMGSWMLKSTDRF